MFNFFFRPYVPGFRVGPDDVPGFNIDDNGLPRRANASFEDTLPDSAAQRYPDAAQTPSPPSISFRLPGAEGWVLSVPPIGSPGFRVSPQDDVPGFNVRPQDDVPGFNIQPREEVPSFNLDENGVQQPKTTWSNGMPAGSVGPQDLNSVQTPTPRSGEEEPTPPASPQLPAWPYQLATILSRLSTAFDPRTERPIAINPLPGLGSPAPPGADPWLSSSAPRQPADINVRSDAAAMQDANPQPAAQQEMRNAWPQPLRNRWPYAMRSAVPPSIPSARPPPHFNLIPANGDDADKQAPQQQMPLQQYQRTQPKIPSAALGTELAAVRLPERPSTKITGLEPRSEQEFSQLIEAYRPLKEAEGRQPSSGQPSPQPPPNENGVYSYASVNDAPSLGHRLVQGSIETLVPGAHYQELARQQLGAGNYVGAGVYQAAALLDAALSIATLGLSTRLAAAGRTAAAEGAALFRRAFDSKSKLLNYLGKAPEGMQWHHIVEQCQAAQFGQRPVQSIENIVALPEKAHRELNAFYSSKQQIYHPNTVREWLRRQSFEAQYEFGMEQLKRVLGY